MVDDLYNLLFMKSLNIKSDEFPFQKHPMILIIGK